MTAMQRLNRPGPYVLLYVLTCLLILLLGFLA